MSRHYIVTGSSEGLGAELSKKLLKDGSIVFGISRRGNSELNANSNFVNFRADVSSNKQINDVFDEILRDFKKIDGVVHAAAVSGPMGRIENAVTTEWVDAININIIGTYNLIARSAKYFREQKTGNFVAVSGGGATSPMPRMTAYAASKTAIVRLVESVARDFDDIPNVTFNAVAPGIMKTKMIDEVIDAGPDLVGNEYYSKILDFRSNGSDSIPKAIELISFLISGNGNQFNGRLISAIWDDWQELIGNSAYLDNHEIHTLRRVIQNESR